jgi:hypothetical protein
MITCDCTGGRWHERDYTDTAMQGGVQPIHNVGICMWGSANAWFSM